MEIPFRSSGRASLGVEWELQLVDRETRELAPGAVEILEALRPDGAEEHPKAKHELLQSTVEIITGVCTTVREAKADLAGTLAEVVAQADRRGLGLLCAGTHPFTDWQTQEISPKERYQELVERMQWLARRLQIFGVHVHVGVRAPEKVIPIVNALCQYVPHFLALSSSSPFWVGCDTGLASARTKIFEGMPTAGLPFQLDDWDEFEEYMETLISTGSIESVREVWWDIRPHPDFGTVELRICDGLPTLDEVGAVAALAQCLVEQFDTQLDRGYTLPRPEEWVVRENKWRATRYGLDAEIIVDEHYVVRPVRDAITELVEELMPTAKRLHCEAELSDVLRILEVGASYQRQRAVALAHDGGLAPVVDGLLAELRDGLPTSGPAGRPDGPVPGPAECAGGHAA
ncbi:glutamate--cysteine ligase [Blastococcus sp. MG754426]|uniref:glutamate--cysteine ligase n=1 Tax=unclassified Blastococcus TaxID=2619396 RepID=UPI001EF137D8|nr:MULTISPECIES: glutamate--cysteine ligase [unclassified Blastococcus]MCF6507949.1 glutamate--cysteine ligase [Blastococcus sp. MG754426]MCF6512531.1 glutamate--cysteine ligase [Blastococcus sp. MG754427]